jgi:ketosteroid isomerase-like protein
VAGSNYFWPRANATWVMNRFTGDPETNLQVVEEGYERFNEGDIEWVLDHLDPGIVWEDAKQMPDARIYRGLGEVRKFLSSFERHWEEIRFEPEQLREAGESVLAFVHFVGRGKTSGAEVDAHLVHVWEFRDLKVRRIRTFFDREEATSAAEAGG